MLLRTDTSLLAQLFSDPQIAAEFSDEQFIRYSLTVEAALAKVQAALGVIPADTAKAIADGTASLKVNTEQLHSAMEKDGVPISELVRQLREDIGGEAASYVHWGATTQDIMDTALVLQVR